LLCSSIIWHMLKENKRIMQLSQHKLESDHVVVQF
jgi:hypothetical protein